MGQKPCGGGSARGQRCGKNILRPIEELAGTKKTQGVVALISPVSYVAPEELFSETLRRSSFLIVLDHLTDPQNVGNLLRSCEVLGGVGALLPRERSSPLNRTVVKASSGAIFHLKLARVSNLHRALEVFRNMGGWIFSVEKGGKDIRVSRRLRELSDEILSIPMRGKVGSLNVSSAGAIAMWEAVRRSI